MFRICNTLKIALGSEKVTARFFRSIPICICLDNNEELGQKTYIIPRRNSADLSNATLYECRKYGHNLPSNDSTPCFDVLPNFPTGVFRCTTGEVLGQGAAKCSCYQCPEYFSYHHMTYYDMHMLLRSYRRPSPKTGRKP